MTVCVHKPSNVGCGPDESASALRLRDRLVGPADRGAAEPCDLWAVLRPRPRRLRSRFKSIHSDMAAELALASSGMTRPLPCAIFLAYDSCALLTGLGSGFPLVSPSALSAFSPFLGACSLRNFRQIDIDVL